MSLSSPSLLDPVAVKGRRLSTKEWSSHPPSPEDYPVYSSCKILNPYFVSVSLQKAENLRLCGWGQEICILALCPCLCPAISGTVAVKSRKILTKEAATPITRGHPYPSLCQAVKNLSVLVKGQAPLAAWLRTGQCLGWDQTLFAPVAVKKKNINKMTWTTLGQSSDRILKT